MNSNRFLLLPLLALALGGCSASRKSAATEASACAPISVPAVNWKAVRTEISPGPELPKKFTAYTVSQTEWSAYASKLKERGPGETTGLNIPMPSGCKAFSVTVSQTMSPELAARYPDLISLKGSATDGSDLRLDWDGKQMRGQIIQSGDTWLIEPHVTGTQTYYLVYHKNDAPATKQAFE